MYRAISAAALVLLAFGAAADDALQWGGFLNARASSATSGTPYYDDPFAVQAQLGFDWRPTVYFGAHLHLLGRDDPQGSRRGAAGVPEAYVELNVPRGADRVRVLAGAFFLPTSRENVDALWESPYSITSSALNTWFGEELRPVGIDVSYTARRAFTLGATLFRGNDTLGALPAERGWTIADHWALLGEHLRVDDEYYTSVSAENDGRLGWSARGRWNNDWASVQVTRLDNRSDARLYGDLFNWRTRFDVIAADVTLRGWTVAAEGGWGPTTIVGEDFGYTERLQASYLLVSRRIGRARATLRQDWYANGHGNDHGTTAALLWSGRGGWRYGIEATHAESRNRLLVEARYYFNK